MSEIESWKTLFLLVILSLILGTLHIKNSRRKISTSKIITLMLIGYSILAFGIIAFLYSLFHTSSYSFENLLNYSIDNSPLISFKVFDKWGFCIDLLTFIAIFVTMTIFVMSIGFSQISLRYLNKNLNQYSDPEVAQNIKNRFGWLKSTKILVIETDKPEAFSFTLLKFKFPMKIWIEDWIIISKGLINLMNDNELESVIAHEYSHIMYHDTRYSHLIFTITSFLFFDPVFKLVKRYMSSKHEMDADMNAVRLVKKPRSLARALFKLLDYEFEKRNYGVPSFAVKEKKIMLKRIKLLLNYANVNEYVL